MAVQSVWHFSNACFMNCVALLTIPGWISYYFCSTQIVIIHRAAFAFPHNMFCVQSDGLCVWFMIRRGKEQRGSSIAFCSHKLQAVSLSTLSIASSSSSSSSSSAFFSSCLSLSITDYLVWPAFFQVSRVDRRSCGSGTTWWCLVLLSHLLDRSLYAQFVSDILLM